ncbi:GNAT family N-acetyltransferase [Adlercreutzia shanghongiae]|uniref:GNAT family N-acetyltransferase n=1 Tax=Adlercreutzia shanghongiae TaxID=3111773 RepID=A0ABU6IYM8_9ACTN|nr:GNAT family N-acetyltransferase [Adlercreutzia sp. R22]MEC4294929.1 GNAT family N-acetyltransferase [Adlercreutzia sp. R22]
MDFVIKRFNELELEEYHELLKLRCAVFVVEQQSPYQEVDDADKEALHLYYRNSDGKLAAYARVLPAGVTHETASIGRVIAAERGTGAGRRIMKEAIRIAQEELDADVITIEAQVQARGFYEKLGFAQTSDEFDDGGIPHIEMKLTRA